MPRPPYSPEADAALRAGYPEGDLDQLAALLGRTVSAIKCRAKRIGVQRKRNYSRWTEREINTVRTMFADTTTRQLAVLLGRTESSVYQQADKLGVSKSAAYLASPAACRLRRGDNVGAAFRFKKGIVPHNKGLRRPGWSPGRMSETQFKKGCRVGAANMKWKPIGTISPDPDGYLRRKVSEGKGGFGNQKAWEFVHRRAWEDANGPIPEGHAVIFRDGNKANTGIENLELVTRAELMKRNTIHRYPKELKTVIRLAKKLKRKIGERDAEQQNDGSAEPSVCNA